MQDLPEDGDSGLPKVPTPSYYVWEVPGKPMRVCLNLQVAERLGLEVTKGFKAVSPQSRREVGGLLLGRKESRDGVTRVVVEDFEVLECEHARSPAYLLSDSDKQRLAERIVHWKSGAGGPLSVVGTYRSHTRSDSLSLDEGDVTLFARYFSSDPSDVFLLIRPAAGKGSVGSFFFWENGRIHRESPYGEFALHRGRLLAGEHRIVQRLRRIWVSAPAAALLIAGVLVLRAHRDQKNKSPGLPAANEPLGLKVERSGGMLRVGWNRESPAIQRARSAVLWITDGDHQSRLNLDARQLTQGSVAYWPSNVEVNFRLEVLDPEHPAAESVRANSVMSASAAEGVGPAAASNETAPRQPDRSRTVLARPGPERELKRPARPSPFRPDRRALNSPVGAGGFAEKSVAPEPVRSASAVSQPEPRAQTAVSEDSPGAQTAQEFATVTVEPVAGSRFGRILGKIPGLRRLRHHNEKQWAPPQAVRQVPPLVPSEARRSVPAGTSVYVKLYIGSSGQVQFAELLPKGSGADSSLASAAVQAARQWEFAPARAGDRKVPSEVVLHFRFGNPVVASNSAP